MFVEEYNKFRIVKRCKLTLHIVVNLVNQISTLLFKENVVKELVFKIEFKIVFNMMLIKNV